MYVSICITISSISHISCGHAACYVRRQYLCCDLIAAVPPSAGAWAASGARNRPGGQLEVGRHQGMSWENRGNIWEHDPRCSMHGISTFGIFGSHFLK